MSTIAVEYKPSEAVYEFGEFVCIHPSTHTETVYGPTMWNPMTQSPEEDEFIIEVCDSCDEEIFSEGDDCED